LRRSTTLTAVGCSSSQSFRSTPGTSNLRCREDSSRSSLIRPLPRCEPAVRFVTLCILSLAMVGQARADQWLDRFTAAEGQYKLGHWQVAHDEFQKLLDDFPSNARESDARFLLGESLVQMRQFDEAADFFADFLDRNPPEPLRRKVAFRAAES